MSGSLLFGIIIFFYRLVEIENALSIAMTMTEDEKIDFVAARIVNAAATLLRNFPNEKRSQERGLIYPKVFREEMRAAQRAL